MKKSSSEGYGSEMKTDKNVSEDNNSQRISLNVKLIADETIDSNSSINVEIKLPCSLMNILRPCITKSTSDLSSSSLKKSKVEKRKKIISKIFEKLLKNRGNSKKIRSTTIISQNDTIDSSVGQDFPEISTSLNFIEEKHRFVLPLGCRINDKIYVAIKPAKIHAEATFDENHRDEINYENFIDAKAESACSYEAETAEIPIAIKTLEAPLFLVPYGQDHSNMENDREDEGYRSKELLEMFVGKLHCKAEREILPKRRSSKISVCSSLESYREEIVPTGVVSSIIDARGKNSVDTSDETWTLQRETSCWTWRNDKDENSTIESTNYSRELRTGKSFDSGDSCSGQLDRDREEKITRDLASRETASGEIGGIVDVVEKWWNPRMKCGTISSGNMEFSSYSVSIDDLS